MAVSCIEKGIITREHLLSANYVPCPGENALLVTYRLISTAIFQMSTAETCILRWGATAMRKDQSLARAHTASLGWSQVLMPGCLAPKPVC